MTRRRLEVMLIFLSQTNVQNNLVDLINGNLYFGKNEISQKKETADI
jgi:hypothetical protein